jgi:hypothetical protein
VVLASSAECGPSQDVPVALVDGDDGEQTADFVAGQRDQAVLVAAGRGAPLRFGGAGQDQERGGGRGQGDVGISGAVSADIVLVRAALVLRGLERLRDLRLAPAVPTRVRSRHPRMNAARIGTEIQS